ncbi:hypothetical protein IWQ60_001921 [Tieghemiomyces parasiticus]|uniref:Major facilitator superfamily (MFS) profile domain-containing protein n=1 Tax=Tieghemiomyces parasiticus TaxID=78921 RepID=A0A9W8AC82_9FUNG|nr:hypothetical protein IWQ60_001921 [Tieghemiomyces parasiticus]
MAGSQASYRSTAESGEAHALETNNELAALETRTLGWTQIRTCLIAGAGFFTDAYDLFIINIASSMLAYVYFGTPNLPKDWDLGIKVSTQVGTLIGQLFFGWAGDRFGRQRIYGFELILIIIGTIGSALSASAVHGFNVLTTLVIMRFVVGIGVGGDYPLSASITSESSSTKYRGALIAAVFAMQGFGILASAFVSAIMVAAFKSAINNDINNLDLAWRLCIGIGAVPAVITVYYRLTMKETSRYTMAKVKDAERAAAAAAEEDESLKAKLVPTESSGAPTAPVLSSSDSPRPSGITEDRRVSYLAERDVDEKDAGTGTDGGGHPAPRTSQGTHFTTAPAAVVAPTEAQSPGYWSSFFKHYSQWKHGKILLACCVCWFSLDVAFYGINLNNGVILNAIGYSSSEDPYENLHQTSIGNIIVNLMGTVPGYWFTVFLVDRMGRKTIQLMGFGILVVIFIILGFAYNAMLEASVAVFVVFFTLAQFFQNFGPNTTTFIYPSEVFPTRFRTTSHGLSAASGKLGAIVAQAGFSQLRDIGGTNAFVPHIIQIFAIFMLIGFGFTFFLPETKGRTLEEISGEDEG